MTILNLRKKSLTIPKGVTRSRKSKTIRRYNGKMGKRAKPYTED
jgi:hypothetical protein